MRVHVPLCNPTLLSPFTLKFLFFFSFSNLFHFYTSSVIVRLAFSLLCLFLTVVLTFLYDYCLTVFSSLQSLYLFPLQMTLPYPSWASQSSLTNSSEGVAMSLPHHQTAAPALPLDQSCLPEESASATRSHSNNSSNSNNNNNSNSHHSSSSFSNTIPEFMESVIDSVSIYHQCMFVHGYCVNLINFCVP